jgi:hypothetical protein
MHVVYCFKWRCCRWPGKEGGGCATRDQGSGLASCLNDVMCSKTGKTNAGNEPGGGTAKREMNWQPITAIHYGTTQEEGKEYAFEFTKKHVSTSKETFKEPIFKRQGPKTYRLSTLLSTSPHAREPPPNRLPTITTRNVSQSTLEDYLLRLEKRQERLTTHTNSGPRSRNTRHVVLDAVPIAVAADAAHGIACPWKSQTTLLSAQPISAVTQLCTNAGGARESKSTPRVSSIAKELHDLKDTYAKLEQVVIPTEAQHVEGEMHTARFSSTMANELTPMIKSLPFQIDGIDTMLAMEHGQRKRALKGAGTSPRNIRIETSSPLYPLLDTMLSHQEHRGALTERSWVSRTKTGSDRQGHKMTPICLNGVGSSLFVGAPAAPRVKHEGVCDDLIRMSGFHSPDFGTSLFPNAKTQKVFKIKPAAAERSRKPLHEESLVRTTGGDNAREIQAVDLKDRPARRSPRSKKIQLQVQVPYERTCLHV